MELNQWWDIKENLRLDAASLWLNQACVVTIFVMRPSSFSFSLYVDVDLKQKSGGVSMMA